MRNASPPAPLPAHRAARAPTIDHTAPPMRGLGAVPQERSLTSVERSLGVETQRLSVETLRVFTWKLQKFSQHSVDIRTSAHSCTRLCAHSCTGSCTHLVTIARHRPGTCARGCGCCTSAHGLGGRAWRWPGVPIDYKGRSFSVGGGGFQFLPRGGCNWPRFQAPNFRAWQMAGTRMDTSFGKIWRLVA